MNMCNRYSNDVAVLQFCLLKHIAHLSVHSSLRIAHMLLVVIYKTINEKN